jgi:phytoene desaturase
MKDIINEVIIIGAGIGGIATAVFLANQGYQVSIYEKNNYPGGRCGQILRDGHRFDIGATILMMPSIYRDVFQSLGLNFDECFDLKELPSVYKVYFQKGEFLSFTTDKVQMKSQLETLEPGSYEKFSKYISTGYKFFKLSIRDLLGKNFYSLPEFISFRNAVLLIRLKTYIKHRNYIRKFFSNEKLQQAFIFQNIYVGQNPLEAPALFAMLPAAELTEGALFPVGGMYSITEKLVSTAVEKGVKFYFGKPVSKILTSDKKAEGILLDDGSVHHAGLVIANADLPYIYRDLLPDKKVSQKLEKKQYACSAMVFHWGLRKVYPQLGHHSVFLSPDFRGSLDRIFNDHSLSDNPSFYIHSPVRTDKSAAPVGEDSLSVVVPMGHLDPKNPQNWSQLIKSTRIAILARLKEIGIDDLEENIKFEICYPPTTWETVFHVTKGAVFGSLKHSIMQMGYFRPHNRHKHYRNLYFVGGSTHPGNGVPLVLLSAKLTSERILRDQKVRI